MSKQWIYRPMPSIENSSKIEREFIESKLIAFNNSRVPFLQEDPFLPISYIIKENEQIIAGINAMLYCWNCLYVDILWIDEKYRNHTYGTMLLDKVENEAKAAGSHLVHLDTFDFQAKDFYLKHGYTIFGTLEDCPLPGRKRYYLQKKL